MTNAPSATAEPGQMTHREIMEALTGLLLAMFVAMLSSTVVSNALPAIVTDLHGSQTGYTWVVVATLLTMTATTPIWGKLADLFSKKLLVQAALGIFSVGSVVAAVAPNMSVLIGARAFQGLGVGGLTALVQVVIASMVSPRERGRYSGYIGAVFATATVSGPLLGGLIVDSPMGWRGCFIVGIPIAAIAFVVLQKTLHLPTVKRDVKIDYAGATLIMAGISLILVWVSLAGTNFDWVSGTSAGLVVGSLILIGAALWVEARVAAEPVIPLRLFRDRTTALATAASVMIGVAMFGATVYLSQYFQLARGMSPTEAGLMSVAMVGGLLVSSIVSGRIITRTGLWKRWLVGGMLFVIAGIALLGTIDATTSLWVVGGYMAITGIGLGATMQNLVLSVQNNVAMEDLGAASSVVAMFRSIGGSAGVAALGAVLAHQVTSGVKDGIAGLVRAGQLSQEQLVALQHSTGDIPKLADLPAPVRAIYEASFGDAVGHLFLVAAPFAVAAFLCILFIKEVPLRTTNGPAEQAGPTVAESEVEAALVAAGEPVDYPAYEVEGGTRAGQRR
ncbi:MDR family MFS transporter [Nocardioides humi]|uniref:Major facilitator superfamily (MFS) profile domain-containing protein n=1 Tax=Nocardioides humi TaxID=449461 RepID=A0ABN2BFI8_9ACTN|nr:MDR family MFS transporter [Nocardioides humi]